MTEPRESALLRAYTVAMLAIIIAAVAWAWTHDLPEQVPPYETISGDPDAK